MLHYPSEAHCIDDFGNVGGNADAFSSLPLAFYRPAGGTMAVAPGLGGNVEDIANTGWVVGGDAFRDPSGTVTPLPPSPATPLRLARAVNDRGQVAGQMADASGSPEYAFRYDQGSAQLTNLGSIGRFGGVTDINSRGTVVGSRRIGQQTDSDALISFGGGEMQRLDDLLEPATGWDVLSISAINELGQMVGIARFQAGPAIGVLIEPTTVSVADSTTVGAACGIQPALFRATPPVLGAPWVAVTANAQPGHVGVSILVPDHHTALSWPNGCSTYVGAFTGAVLTPFTINAGGNAVARFELPLVPSWAGVRASAQALLVDPSGTMGWTATEAAQMVFGL